MAFWLQTSLGAAFFLMIDELVVMADRRLLHPPKALCKEMPDLDSNRWIRTTSI